jgi:hypothetical protein
VTLADVARWLVARLRQPSGFSDDGIRQWHTVFPGRCMYCSYTRWANTEQGQNLAIEVHDCIEGNSPPAPLPVAKIHR